MLWTLMLLGCLTLVGAHDTVKMGIPSNSTRRTPVILIPGDGGSRIYARYSQPSLICPVSKDWFPIWLNLEFLLPMTEFCLPKFFKLNYNRTTRRTCNQPGVETTVFHWGDTQGVETLDDSGYAYSFYFYKLAEALVQAGYRRGVDLRGAPFDFRKAPYDNEDFVHKFKALVEETYHNNGNQRVALLAHSLGNIYTLYFLRLMPETWKKRFVRSYLAVAAPLGGATKPLRLMTSGDTLNEPIFFSSYMRMVERSMSSTPLLFPSPHFWEPEEVLLRRPGRNYTVTDYEQLFKDIKYANGWEMYKDASRSFDPLWVPDVDELFCFHGSGRHTPGRLVWEKDAEFPDYTPKVEFDDGDGTVNVRSLRGCRRWPRVRAVELTGAEHLGIIGDKRLIAEVVSALALADRSADHL